MTSGVGPWRPSQRASRHGINAGNDVTQYNGPGARLDHSQTIHINGGMSTNEYNRMRQDYEGLLATAEAEIDNQPRRFGYLALALCVGLGLLGGFLMASDGGKTAKRVIVQSTPTPTVQSTPTPTVQSTPTPIVQSTPTMESGYKVPPNLYRAMPCRPRSWVDFFGGDSGSGVDRRVADTLHRESQRAQALLKDAPGPGFYASTLQQLCPVAKVGYVDPTAGPDGRYVWAGPFPTEAAAKAYCRAIARTITYDCLSKQAA